jgi:hypothetical protein
VVGLHRLHCIGCTASSRCEYARSGPRVFARAWATDQEVAQQDGPVTILVDPAMWPWRGRLWAHLVSDSSHEELHAFAARLDIPRQVFQGDHYDVLPVPARELVARLSAAGLRRRKRR